MFDFQNDYILTFKKKQEKVLKIGFLFVTLHFV